MVAALKIQRMYRGMLFRKRRRQMQADVAADVQHGSEEAVTAQADAILRSLEAPVSNGLAASVTTPQSDVQAREPTAAELMAKLNDITGLIHGIEKEFARQVRKLEGRLEHSIDEIRHEVQIKEMVQETVLR